MQKSILNSDESSLWKTPKGSGVIDMIIDWCQCTFKTVELPKLLEQFNISLDDCTFVPSGIFGYQYTYVYKEKIKFMISSDDSMGIHLMLSGKACREWEDYIQGSWDLLFEVVYLLQGKVTRIDFAFDSFTNQYFTVSKVMNALRAGTISTRAKYAINTEKWIISEQRVDGHSIKFGNSSSEVSLIFYDKLAERKAASYEVDSSVTIWQRLELRLRGKSANNFIWLYYASNLDETIPSVKSILKNYINFKTHSGEKQVRHRQNIKWWEEFITDIEPIQLSKKAIQTGIQQKQLWIENSVAKSLAMLFIADVEDYAKDELMSYVKKGTDKLKKYDLEMINSYRIQKGGSILTKEQYALILKKLNIRDSLYNVDLTPLKEGE